MSKEPRTYRVEIPLRDCRISMKEVVDWVEGQKRIHPDREYFMDGDTYAICSCPRDA